MKCLNAGVNRGSSSISSGSRRHGLPRGVKARVIEEQVLHYVMYLTGSIGSTGSRSNGSDKN